MGFFNKKNNNIEKKERNSYMNKTEININGKKDK